MSNPSKPIIMPVVRTVVLAALVGSLLTVSAYSIFSDGNNKASTQASPEVVEPLYWVAPMDPNYQRDKPGKSPMGMDLVPVYPDNMSVNNSTSDRVGADPGPGTIRISPEVVNNLGVRTDLVERKTLHQEIKTVGYVKYDEDKMVHIHPRVEGWVEKLYVKAAGDPVEKDQPLYEIYSPALVNAQEELVLALGRNNERLVRAAKDRLTALQLPPKAIEQLIKTRSVQQNVTFFSPQTGVLDNLNIRQGFYVQPGTSLMSIAVLDPIWVEAEVFEDQAAAVSAGLGVTMTMDFLPGNIWQGRVDYVYPTLDVKTRTLKVRLRFDNDNRDLKPNMFAEVAIHTRSTADAILIPKSAVVRTGTMDRAVLALGDGRYKSVQVTLGRSGDEYIEILKGLSAGDRIVTSAQFLIDSESSKTSDFKRMNYAADINTMTSVWAGAEVNSVMPEHRMVNVSHGVITLWDWPAMTMDFPVADSVDMALFKINASLNIEIEKKSGGYYEIIAAHATENSASHNEKILHKTEQNSARATGTINRVALAEKSLIISRGPIEKWNRPAATVNFKVLDSIDLNNFRVDQTVQFSFIVNKGEFIIDTISLIAEAE